MSLSNEHMLDFSPFLSRPGSASRFFHHPPNPMSLLAWPESPEASCLRIPSQCASLPPFCRTVEGLLSLHFFSQFVKVFFHDITRRSLGSCSCSQPQAFFRRRAPRVVPLLYPLSLASSFFLCGTPPTAHPLVKTGTHFYPVRVGSSVPHLFVRKIYSRVLSPS